MKPEKLSDMVEGRVYVIVGDRARFASGTEVVMEKGRAQCNDNNSVAMVLATDITSTYWYVSYDRLKELHYSFNKGDVVEVVLPAGEGGVLNPQVRKGDIAQYDGGSQFTMLTGNLKGKVQSNTGGHCFKLLRAALDEELPFTPFTLEFGTREDAELLKAIMHLHNKVADSSYFNLDFTPDKEDVREFMKATFSKIEDNCPGWEKYNK